MSKRNSSTKILNKKSLSILASILVLGLVIIGGVKLFTGNNAHSLGNKVTQVSDYKPTDDEKKYLKSKFDGLSATNSDTIAYIYAPGTQLDEPVVQTKDNSTYLDKTFEGGNKPLFGTVFMDTDNKKDFSDRLTWLFGHARGSQVEDHRMFNDVNYYDKQEYLDQHPYVVIETPERKYYYEVMGLVIVPEDTAFYRTSFTDDNDFTTQLKNIYESARTKNPNIKIKASDKYLVLSTCREEDETIRSNLYLRQIPDSEMKDFVAKHADQLKYVATRGQQ